MFSARFSPNWLSYDADDLRALLGPYATWLLSPESAPVDSLTGPGVAVILLANDHTKAPALPDASLLPTRWVRVVSQPVGLPRELIRQASEVVALLGKDFEGWKLAPLDETLGSMDLSELPIEGSSGFATLAAALIIAVGRGRTQARVFASVGWSGEYLAQVGGITRKIELINRLTPATVFVHPTNKEEARKAASSGLVVRECSLSTPGVSSSVIQQLRPLLDALGVRPAAPDSSLDDCIDAFNARGTWSSEEERRTYYDKHIRERLGERMREVSRVEPGKCLLLVYNPTNEPTCRLMLDLTRPRRVLALRQPSVDSTKDLSECDRARALAEASGVALSEVKVETLSPSAPEDELRATMNELRDFISDGYADAMNGTSFLKSFAVVLASRSGLVPIALEQGWDRDGMFIGKHPKVQRFGFVLPG